MLLNWYSSTKFFLERFRWFLMLKIDLENQILALFDSYFWPFNKSHEKIKSIFVISAIIPSIWNVFIKFRWHDEKLTDGKRCTITSQSQRGMRMPKGTITFSVRIFSSFFLEFSALFLHCCCLLMESSYLCHLEGMILWLHRL